MTTRQVASEFGWQSGSESDDDGAHRGAGIEDECLELPAGFIRFSDAISRLANGTFGGLQRPAPVVAMKRIHKTASIGFAEWRKQVGQRLTNSTMNESQHGIPRGRCDHSNPD